MNRRTVRWILLPSLILSICASTSTQTFACDFCNCLAGINPTYNGSNNIGLTILTQSSHAGGSAGWPELLKPDPYTTPYGRVLHGGGSHLTGRGSEAIQSESRITLEFSWQHHLSRHVSFNMMVPLVENRMLTDELSGLSGLGDVVIESHYIINHLFSERLPSTLLLGGGMVLPTGSTSRSDESGERLSSDLQPGRGSVGLMASTLLVVPVEGSSLSFDLRGLVSFSNSLNERAGANISVGTRFSHDLYRNDPANIGIVGSLGLRGEATGEDRLNGVYDTTTGSRTLWIQGGPEFVYHNVKLDASLLVPVAQDRNDAAGTEDIRLLAGIRVEY